MKIALIIIGSLLILYVVYCLIGARIVVHFITKPHFRSREERRKINENKNLINGTENYHREDVSFIMSDGYIINGDITLNNPKKFMVFVHGHGSNREGCMKFVKIFYDLGYSLVLFDNRGHGDNSPARVTMGYQESKDLAEIVKKIKESYGNDIEIGIFGYSMGGATVCLASKYLQNDVKFIISDCAYSSLAYQSRTACLLHNFPFVLTSTFMNAFFKVKYGFSYKECDAKKAISLNKLPICFFHGMKDRKVFPKNADILYNVSTSKIKRLNYFEEAGHSECVEVDSNRYTNIIKEFINSIGD